MPKDSESDRQGSGWTTGTWAIHSDALRQADIRFENERDRRYSEVNIEKEKALKIKETADLAALQLARESQSLKEVQNDALRDKTLSESGIYATNASVTNLFDQMSIKIQAVLDQVSTIKGNTHGSEMTWGKIAGTAALLIAGYAALRTGTNPVIK